MKWSLVFDGLHGRSRWASVEDIRRAFRDYHDALRWLAGLVVEDEGLAEACVVDACTVTERQSQMFHEWLIHWAGVATVRCAIQKQHERIVELAGTYAERDERADIDRPPLSADHCRVLIDKSMFVRERFDLLCRLVLIVRGMARNSYDDTAAELAITSNAVRHAYAVAFDTLEHISLEPLELSSEAPAGGQ